MLLCKKILLVFLFLNMLSSCGFSPVHKQTDESSQNTSSNLLAAIDIAKPKTLEEQILTNDLADLLNPKSLDTEKKYDLTYKVKQSEIGLIIERDSTVTRYKIEIQTHYTLTDKTTNKAVAKGVVRREGEYDKVESDYATYISRKGTIKRLLKEVAQEIRIRLTSQLSGK